MQAHLWLIALHDTGNGRVNCSVILKKIVDAAIEGVDTQGEVKATAKPHRHSVPVICIRNTQIATRHIDETYNRTAH